jgi:hypothetical protein
VGDRAIFEGADVLSRRVLDVDHRVRDCTVVELPERCAKVRVGRIGVVRWQVGAKLKGPLTDRAGSFEWQIALVPKLARRRRGRLRDARGDGLTGIWSLRNEVLCR